MGFIIIIILLLLLLLSESPLIPTIPQAIHRCHIRNVCAHAVAGSIPGTFTMLYVDLVSNAVQVTGVAPLGAVVHRSDFLNFIIVLLLLLLLFLFLCHMYMNTFQTFW